MKYNIDLATTRSISGWCVGSAKLIDARCFRNDHLLGRSGSFTHRPDVQAAYPNEPFSLTSGFSIHFERPIDPDGHCYIEFAFADGSVKSTSEFALQRVRDEARIQTNADFTIYRDLPDFVWANLVFDAASLPPLPPEDLQRSWCGNAGAALATQSCEFYQLLKSAVARYGVKPYASAKVLDFGCGWGRLTRLMAKDLPASQIYGCDPDEDILKWCTHLPGTFVRSAHRPRSIPFDVKFDLAFAFSVFTHLGPRTHKDALNALHRSLADDGLLVVTIRPRAFIEQKGIELARLPDETIGNMLQQYDAGSFVYHPYSYLQPIDGEVTYGEAAIPLAYVERHWLDRYELLSVETYRSDPFQVPLVLRKT